MCALLILSKLEMYFQVSTIIESVSRSRDFARNLLPGTSILVGVALVRKQVKTLSFIANYERLMA